MVQGKSEFCHVNDSYDLNLVLILIIPDDFAIPPFTLQIAMSI